MLISSIIQQPSPSIVFTSFTANIIFINDKLSHQSSTDDRTYQLVRFHKTLTRNMEERDNGTRVGADSEMLAILLITSNR